MNKNKYVRANTKSILLINSFLNKFHFSNTFLIQYGLRLIQCNYPLKDVLGLNLQPTRCLAKWSFLTNPFWQKSHFEGNWWLWTEIMCLFKSHFTVYDLEHKLHWYGLTLVCFITWIFNFSWLLNFLPHTLHLNILVSSWAELTCCVLWHILSKRLSQNWQGYFFCCGATCSQFSVSSKGRTCTWIVNCCCASTRCWDNCGYCCKSCAS